MSTADSGSRKATGADRFDEVWNGVYVMDPMPNNEHQTLATELGIIFGALIDWNGLGWTFVGANVSDRERDWTENYRIPDVLVFLAETKAKDCGTHWCGGPDFAVEIIGTGDHTPHPDQATIGKCRRLTRCLNY
ncbi:MAG: Uma2 family endonuclease [Pirellulaceae bacterium]